MYEPKIHPSFKGVGQKSVTLKRKVVDATAYYKVTFVFC